MKTKTRNRHTAGDYQNFLQRKVTAGRAEMIASIGHLNEEVEAEFAKRRAAAHLRLQ